MGQDIKHTQNNDTEEKRYFLLSPIYRSNIRRSDL